MGFLNTLMAQRSSCRAFLDRPVDEDTLREMLEIASQAPSAGGFQNYSVIHVKDAEKREKLRRLCRGQLCVRTAPVCLVICADHRRLVRVNQEIPAPYQEPDQFSGFCMSQLDCGIFAQTFCLEAEARGLKTVYIGNVINQADQTSQLLRLPKYVYPVIMVLCGYPSQVEPVSRKYPLKTLLHQDEYRDLPLDELMADYNDKYADWQRSLPPGREKRFRETCLWQGGESLVSRCMEYIHAHNNQLSVMQFWYGLWYLPAPGFLDFDGFRSYMEKQGYGCLSAAPTPTRED